MTDKPAPVVAWADAQGAVAVFAACDMCTAVNDFGDGFAADEVCLAVLDGTVPVGVAVGRPASISMEGECEETDAVLEVLAVVPQSRGQGIGSRLLQVFESEARKAGASNLQLRVAPAQRPNLATFYSDRGFSEVEPGHWMRKLTQQ